jgi:hypothetical protein
MSSKDKMCNGCYNELTLAQYKALMAKVELEELEEQLQLQLKLEQQTKTTKKTKKKFDDDATEEE